MKEMKDCKMKKATQIEWLFINVFILELVS